MNKESLGSVDSGETLAKNMVDDVETGVRHPKGVAKWAIPVIAFMWSCFQLALPKLIILQTIHIRTIHLAFAALLAYLAFPMLKTVAADSRFKFLALKDRFHAVDIVLALIAAAAALYLSIDYMGIAGRSGLPNMRDIVVGGILIILLLEAARRTLGPALPIVATVFMVYVFIAPYMPSFMAFKGASINQFFSQVTLTTEGVFGVPLDVSANIVFLFVLFGALLERAGGGQYFVDLAFSLMGGFKGGPAKASIFASGCTGMISGSSIANTVTTGTFTIPLMKKIGMPAHKAGAVEVAASTNGQLTPPIMGAAAFIIAEYTNMAYFDVIKSAIIPALVAYIGLFYIAHLEASKLGLVGLTKAERPAFWKTFLRGLHYLIPLFFLIYQLMVLRRSPEVSAYYAIIVLMGVTVIQEAIVALRDKKSFIAGVQKGIQLVASGMVAGAKNMVGIAVATATAGIIVAVVTLGLGSLINNIVAVLAGGNLIVLLFIAAIASLILGMGLPTTANYIVMASLTAPLIVSLGSDMGLVVPLIAAHLFVFYFGILADDTPPVGLAAYAAAAIAKSDPIKTGIQGFAYDIRTAVLPFVFIFNTELLLIGVDSIAHGMWIFAMTAIGMMAFTAAIQQWIYVKNKWYETVILLMVSVALFRPDFVQNLLSLESKQWSYLIGCGIFLLVYLLQRKRGGSNSGIQQGLSSSL